jgi:hypothetical protein
MKEFALAHDFACSRWAIERSFAKPALGPFRAWLNDLSGGFVSFLVVFLSRSLWVFAAANLLG